MPNKSKKRATSIYSAPKIKRAWYTYALVVAVFGLLTWGYITYVWNFIFEWMFLHPQSNINHILLGMIYFVGGTGLFSLLVTSYYKVVFLHPGPVPAEWKLSEQELRDLQKKNFDSIRQRAEAVNKRAAQANATPAEPAPVEEEDDEEHSDKKALLHNSSEMASSSSAPNANNESESSPEVVSHQEEEAEHHHHHHKRQVSEFKHDGSIRICTYCKLQKPDRSHHCSSCGTCVLKMDHHCPWINNCVGFHNYKFFLLFLIYTSVCALFFNFTTMFKFLNIFRIDGPAGMLYYPSLGDFNLAFVFFISFFFGFSVAIFFLFHLKLVFDNQTTLESMEKNRKILRQHDGRNPYDEGWTRNFQSVFGTKWQYWLLPTLESVPGDGVTFPIFRKRDDQV